MRYEDNLLASFEMDFSNAYGQYAYYSDGYIAHLEDDRIDLVNGEVYITMGQAINYANRFVEQTHGNLLAVVLCTYDAPETYGYILTTNVVSYITFDASSSDSLGYNDMYLSLVGKYVTDNLDTFGDCQDVTYYTANYYAYNSVTINNYYVELGSNTEGLHHKSVFDYENIYNGENVSDTVVLRGENVTMQNSFIQFDLSETYAHSIKIGFGENQYRKGFNNGYQNGYGNGYQSGYVVGNDNGYRVGINANTNISNPTMTPFNAIGQAFNAVGGIMQLEVLPNITLGLCFSIPLVIVMIMTIFKLVRK